MIFILPSAVLKSVQLDQGPKSVFSLVDARTLKSIIIFNYNFIKIKLRNFIIDLLIINICLKCFDRYPAIVASRKFSLLSKKFMHRYEEHKGI